MAYPFLPVNPCCTDVVINDPCGCSSTITNSGCNNNNPCSTHLTASSTIVYDGPALTCTTAEPCDTLNVILQKIDEIICNLLSQINILTNQVTNITTQIITINNQIININNTLDVCCNVTTTTTTTTIPCTCINIIISQADIDDATGNPTLNGNVNVGGSNGKQITCENQDLVMHYDTAGTYPYCLKTGAISTISLYYLKDGDPVTNIQSEIVNLQSACTVDGECGPTTTTTTTIVPTTTTTTVAPTTTTTTLTPV